jgi:hypothetical protein
LIARSNGVEPREFEYESLIVAAGASHSYFDHSDWEQDALGLKAVEDAVADPAAELVIHLVPVLLHGGTWLFENIGVVHIPLETMEVIESRAATHLPYRVLNDGPSSLNGSARR